MTKGAKKKSSDVPDDEHIARYCNHQVVIRDPVTNSFEGIFPQAFFLRDKTPSGKPEQYLSVNMFEASGTDDLSRFQNIVAKLRGKKIKAPPLSAVAVLNVGDIRGEGNKRSHSIRVKSKASGKDPTYAGISGLPLTNDDLELLTAFACEHCSRIEEVSEIDKGTLNTPQKRLSPPEHQPATAAAEPSAVEDEQPVEIPSQAEAPPHPEM